MAGAGNVATYPHLKDDLIQQNLNNIAKLDSRLAKAVKGDNGKPNYNIGSGTVEEAERLGKLWVGDGARKTSNGGWISADGLRGYRPAKYKPNTPTQYNPTGTQANFETYKYTAAGERIKIGNGHLIIK